VLVALAVAPTLLSFLWEMTTARAIPRGKLQPISTGLSEFFSVPAYYSGHFLVYWENEGSVTAVPCTSVDHGVVGERKAIKQGKDSSIRKLIYSGKYCVNPAMY